MLPLSLGSASYFAAMTPYVVLGLSGAFLGFWARGIAVL